METSTDTPKPRHCPLGVAFTTKGEPVYLFCKTWKCPHCAKRLAYKWARRAQAAFIPDEHGETVRRWFLTLTLSSYYQTPDQGFAALKKLWDKTRKAFQRSHPNWTYLAFVEGQPERDDMPHFHILSAQTPPVKLNKKGQVTKHNLHDWAVALGWGFEVDLKPVDGDGAAWYVAKYASKVSPHHPKNLRRVRASKDWPKEPKAVVTAVMIRKKGEPLTNYLNRVAHECNIPYQEIQTRYYEANQQLAQTMNTG